MDSNHFYSEMVRLQEEQLNALKKVIALLEAASTATKQDAPIKRTRTAADAAVKQPTAGG